MAFFFLAQGLKAQKEPLGMPVWVLKYSPISLVDFFTPAVQFSGERFLSDHFSLNLDAGYLFNYPNLRGEILTGYRLRPSVRFYKASRRNPNAIKFKVFEFMYKDAYTKKSDWFCRQDCAYLENLQYWRKAETFALNAGFGRLYKVGNSMNVEWHLSWGLRSLEYSTKSLPSDAVMSGVDPFFFGNSPISGFYVFPSMVIGFKIGWILKE